MPMTTVQVKAYQRKQRVVRRDAVVLDLADRATWRVLLRDLLKTRGIKMDAESRLTVTTLDGKYVGQVFGA